MSASCLALIPLIAFLIFGSTSVLIDLREHRLPNKLTLRLTVVVLASQTLTSIALANWANWPAIIKTVLWLFGSFLIIYFLSRNSLGFGDVKFAIPCALIIGWYSPSHWAAFLWVSFGCAALIAVLLWLVGRATSTSAIAFGPFMYLGVLIVATNALLSG